MILNVVPSYNVNANVLADTVGGYLDQLIQAGGGDKNYSIEMKRNVLPIILVVEIVILPRLGIMVQ